MKKNITRDYNNAWSDSQIIVAKKASRTLKIRISRYEHYIIIILYLGCYTSIKIFQSIYHNLERDIQTKIIANYLF